MHIFSFTCLILIPTYDALFFDLLGGSGGSRNYGYSGGVGSNYGYSENGQNYLPYYGNQYAQSYNAQNGLIYYYCFLFN